MLCFLCQARAVFAVVEGVVFFVVEGDVSAIVKGVFLVVEGAVSAVAEGVFLVCGRCYVVVEVVCKDKHLPER